MPIANQKTGGPGINFDMENLFRVTPRNQMMHDMAVEHRKMIHGAYYNAIREITGKKPDIEDMRQHGGIETFEHLGFADYIYRKQTILRVFAPEFVHRDGRTIINQKVLEVWKTNARHRRK